MMCFIVLFHMLYLRDIKNVMLSSPCFVFCQLIDKKFLPTDNMKDLACWLEFEIIYWKRWWVEWTSETQQIFVGSLEHET